MIGKPKIIIIDDSLLVRNILSDVLEKKAGFEVIATGKTGLDGVELAEKLKPDFIILDIEMPVMTGQELCEQLEKLLPDRTFPVYVITGVTDLVHRKWTREIRDLHFLEKPVSIRRLAQELEQRLRS